MMGSKISVESSESIGSKFSFDVTFGKGGPILHQFAEKQEELVDLSAFKILVVEDNQMNQKVLCGCLIKLSACMT